MRAIGVSGELRVGYQLAATLGAWSLNGGPTFTFEAALSSSDRFWLDRRPIDLVLHIGDVEWIWRGQAISINNDIVSASITERPIVESRRSRGG